ncbi:hypothetical protein FHS21_006166 [Phyllobacterium trifolii]|uniref:Uncharacterized protein n=1 Tax=Phyllobacterium trifolii TaxID=300193 RepID=A0A839ULZ7_9HYPH|nr:hypothetical protein [Phyllobacterium trifolii]
MTVSAFLGSLPEDSGLIAKEVHRGLSLSG